MIWRGELRSVQLRFGSSVGVGFGWFSWVQANWVWVRQFTSGVLWLCRFGCVTLGSGSLSLVRCVMVRRVELRSAKVCFVQVRQFGFCNLGFGSFGWSKLSYVQLS